MGENRPAFLALEWKFGLQGEVFHSLRKTFNGELPYVRDLLHRLSLQGAAGQTKHVGPPSAAEKTRWEQAALSKARLHEELGVVEDNWDGWVTHERFKWMQ